MYLRLRNEEEFFIESDRNFVRISVSEKGKIQMVYILGKDSIKEIKKGV